MQWWLRMDEFLELDDLYRHLEKKADEYKYDHNISDLFQKLRDKKHEAKQEDEAHKAQWEIDCFSFRLKNGELKSLFTATDNKGQPFKYPTIENLSDSELDYFEKRLDSTSNPILKARYSHVLWGSSRKHNKFANAAVDSYLGLIKIYESKDKDDPSGHYGLEVVTTIKNAAALSFQSNYKTDEVRSEMIRLVKDFNFKSSSSFALRANIIQYMLDGKGKSSKGTFDGLSKICIDMGQNLFQARRFHNAITMFELGEKIDKKLGIKSHDWNKSIAESYEGQINKRGDEDLASISFCQSALEYYRKIKDTKKVEELEKRYEKIKSLQSYQEFRQDIDLSKTIKESKKLAEDLCEGQESEKLFLCSLLIRGFFQHIRAWRARRKKWLRIQYFQISLQKW